MNEIEKPAEQRIRERTDALKTEAKRLGYTWKKYRNVTSTGNGSRSGCISTIRVSKGYEIFKDGEHIAKGHSLREALRNWEFKMKRKEWEAK